MPSELRPEWNEEANHGIIGEGHATHREQTEAWIGLEAETCQTSPKNSQETSVNKGWERRWGQGGMGRHGEADDVAPWIGHDKDFWFYSKMW